MPDGTKLYGKQILNDPEKYFTEDIMKKLEEASDKEFSYGKGSDAELSTNESAEEKTEG
jgi:hypothetical protein